MVAKDERVQRRRITKNLGEKIVEGDFEGAFNSGSGPRPALRSTELLLKNDSLILGHEQT